MTHSFPLHLRIQFKWLSLKWRTRYFFWKRFAPHKCHVEWLTDYDGEPPYYVRADLAKTPEDVVAYIASEWGMSAEEISEGMDPAEDIHKVWMLMREDKTRDEDEQVWYEWANEDTPGAIEYWRWGW